MKKKKKKKKKGNGFLREIKKIDHAASHNHYFERPKITDLESYKYGKLVIDKVREFFKANSKHIPDLIYYCKEKKVGTLIRIETFEDKHTILLKFENGFDLEAFAVAL